MYTFAHTNNFLVQPGLAAEADFRLTLLVIQKLHEAGDHILYITDKTEKVQKIVVGCQSCSHIFPL